MPDDQAEVRDESIDGRPDDGSLEIERGGRQIRHGLLVGGERRRRHMLGVLLVFVRNGEVRELYASTGVALPHQHLGVAGRQIGFGRGDGQLVACLIDNEQDVTLVDRLIVPDPQVGHEPGDVRRNGDDIGAHPGVARPRREHVVVPQFVGPEATGRDDQQRGDDARQSLHHSFHHGTMRSGRKHESGEQAEEKPESGERRMPQQTIEAEARDQPVHDDEHQERGKEVEEE